MAATPDHDITARDLAEAIHAAYARQADGTLHPQQEQALLARLAEALGRALAGSPGEVVEAANVTLDAWEQAEPGTRGPRIQAVDLPERTVRLR